MKAKYILLWFLPKVLIKMSVSYPVCSLSVNPEIAGSCLCGLHPVSLFLPDSIPQLSLPVYTCVALSLFCCLLCIIFLLFLPLVYCSICIYIIDLITHTHTSAYCAWCGFCKPFISFKRMLFRLPLSPWWFAELYVLCLSFLKSLSPAFSRVWVFV